MSSNSKLASLLPFTGVRKVGLKQIARVANDGDGLRPEEVTTLRRFATLNGVPFTADREAEAAAKALPVRAELMEKTSTAVEARWNTVGSRLLYAGAAAVLYALFYVRTMWWPSLVTAMKATIDFVWDFRLAFVYAAAAVILTFVLRQMSFGWARRRKASFAERAAVLRTRAGEAADIAEIIRKTA